MQNSILTKTCRKCLRELPLSAYHKNKEGRFGVRPECRDCAQTRRRKYYLKNQNALRQYSNEYYSQNSEKVKEYQKQYTKENEQKIKSRAADWRHKNREILLMKKREYYLENKEQRLEYFRKYCQENPEYVQLCSARRRARKRNAKGSFTKDQWFEKCEFFNWQCYLCKKSLTVESAHIEHRIPLSRGGTNWIANIAPACETCNLRKSNKTEKEYRKAAKV